MIFLDVKYYKVAIKTGYSENSRIAIATIVGFTQKYVVLIWCPGSGNCMCRLPHNVVKVIDAYKWKYSI